MNISETECLLDKTVYEKQNELSSSANQNDSLFNVVSPLDTENQMNYSAPSAVFDRKPPFKKVNNTFNQL